MVWLGVHGARGGWSRRASAELAHERGRGRDGVSPRGGGPTGQDAWAGLRAVGVHRGGGTGEVPGADVQDGRQGPACPGDSPTWRGLLSEVAPPPEGTVVHSCPLVTPTRLRLSEHRALSLRGISW